MKMYQIMNFDPPAPPGHIFEYGGGAGYKLGD